VEGALAAAEVAGAVRIVSDGEIALHGAFGGGAGVLLIAGTGSVAYGRGPDGRVARCGGWGMIVGDEGSGFAIGRAALAASLRAVDGRGPPTVLLERLLHLLKLDGPRGIPPWAGRADKAKVAALATHVIAAAEEGDTVARDLLRHEAADLAVHAEALADRLSPWPGEVPVVFHGGVLSAPLYARLVTGEMKRLHTFDFQVRPAADDAVAGALMYARRTAAEEAEAVGR
jgi:glucosamine kinase